MLIHLGHGVAIPQKDIIAVVDLQTNASSSTDTLLDNMQKAKQVTMLGENPKTLILCNLERGIFPRRTCEIHCFLSSVGIRTIVRRTNEPFPSDEI